MNETKKQCQGCQQWFKPFKKSSFCAKCLHYQLTQRQGVLRRRYQNEWSLN